MQKLITLFIILMGLLVLAGCAPNTTTPMPDSTGNEDKTVPLQAGVQEIGGVVLGGGDQTPEGLLGGPVTYLYQVRLDGPPPDLPCRCHQCGGLPGCTRNLRPGNQYPHCCAGN